MSDTSHNITIHGVRVVTRYIFFFFIIIKTSVIDYTILKAQVDSRLQTGVSEERTFFLTTYLI
jgi:hypothetical protein